MMHIYVFGIASIIIIYKEKVFKNLSIFVVQKVNRDIHLIIWKDLEIYYSYHLVLAFNIYLVDNVSIVYY